MNEAPDKYVHNNSVAIACGYSVVPAICEDGFYGAIEAFLICVIVNLVRAFNVFFERTAFAAIQATNVAHYALT